MSGARSGPTSGQSGRRWGWHQLSRIWAARVVDDAGVAERHLVLDLGAGTGALTVPLVRTGARVWAVELHPGRVSLLREAVRAGSAEGGPAGGGSARGSGPAGSVTIIQHDLLTLTLPSRPFRVVANPPFAVSAALVRRLTARGSRLVRADLVLPVALVQRWVRRPPRGFVATRGRYVPAHAFSPPATSSAAVLVLSRSASSRPGPSGSPSGSRSGSSCRR